MHTPPAARRHPVAAQAPNATWQRTVAAQGSIEWEDVPSLAHRLRRALDGLDATGPRAPAWDATMPAELMPAEPASPTAPLRQVLDGLAVREVDSAALFRHFFGQH